MKKINFFTNHIYNKLPAFTLMELLVSIAIFLIITGMVITNFRVGQYRDELTGAAEALTTATREMQTATTSGRTVDCDYDPSTPPTPVKGFGVNISADLEVIRYADCKLNNKFDVGDDFVIQEDSNISPNVSEVGLLPLTVNYPVNLVFSSISEVVVVNESNPAPVTEDVIITLEHARSGKTIQFFLNPVSGRIYYD